MSFCVITYLIGRNDRAVCKRHGLSWRCIQCHKAHSASHSGASWASHGHRVQTSRASTSRIDVRVERECHHSTRKLDHQASSEARGSATILCHTCLKRPVLYYYQHWSKVRTSLARKTTQAGLPSLSQSERRGNYFSVVPN